MLHKSTLPYPRKVCVRSGTCIYLCEALLQNIQQIPPGQAGKHSPRARWRTRVSEDTGQILGRWAQPLLRLPKTKSWSSSGTAFIVPYVQPVTAHGELSQSQGLHWACSRESCQGAVGEMSHSSYRNASAYTMQALGWVGENIWNLFPSSRAHTKPAA